MAGFFDFFKKVDDEFIYSTPSLFADTKASTLVIGAIEEELNIYNFSGDKRKLLRLSLEGSVAAALAYDEELREKLSKATTDEEKKKIIKGYLQAYIKEEIDLELASAKQQIRQNIINNDIKSGGDFFAFFDPRFKGVVKKGDYSQYDGYREKVSKYFFPDSEKFVAPSTTSELRINLGEFVKEWNDRSPAAKGIGASVVSFASTTSATARKLLEDDLNAQYLKKFLEVTGDLRVFDSVTGTFIKFSDMAVKANVNLKLKEKENLFNKKLSPQEVAKLSEYIIAGDVSAASKYFNLEGSGLTADKLVKELGTFKEVIKIDDSGIAKVVGDNKIEAIFKSALNEFSEKLQKNPENAVLDVHDSYFVTTSMAVKSILSRDTAEVRENKEALKDLLARSELASNIINLSKALKKESSLSTADQATLSNVKLSILKAVTDGVIKFDNESHKQEFIDAVNSGNRFYLKNFVTPGLVNINTFSSFLKETNELSLQLAGKVGSPHLASLSINFGSHTAIFQRKILNQFIYAAQIGFDQGYLVSEIKKKLKNNKFAKMWATLDSSVSWDEIKGKISVKFIDLIVKTQARLGGPKSFNEKDLRGDLQTLLDFYSGKLSFGDIVKRQLVHRAEFFLDKRGLNNLAYLLKGKIDFKTIVSNSVLVKNLTNLVKQQLIKNSKYLRKALEMLINKFIPGAGGFVSKFLKYGGHYLSRYLGSFGSSISNFTNKLLGGKFDIAEFEKIAAKVALGCFAMVLVFVLFVLAPMQIIMAALNSLSQNREQTEVAADITYGGPFSLLNQNNLSSSGIFTSGNACVDPFGLPNFGQDKVSKWSNLKISDFEGTVNTKNCRVMCNAKITMGRMFIGSAGALDCNAKETILDSKGTYDPFMCTDLPIRAYADDDSGISGQRLVIGMDSYLKSKSVNPDGLYIRTDLATPSPDSDLTSYDAQCIPEDKISPGSIIIFRVNTCNDRNYTKSYYDSKKLRNVTQTVYDTINNITGNKVASMGGHVELVLKVEDRGGEKVVYTVATNSTIKKPSYVLKSCGNNTYSFQVAKGWGYLRGEEYGKGDSYPCRMYELRNVSENLPCSNVCELGPNNYPDKSNYESIPVLVP